MFRATFCPSPGALLNCSRSLRFPYKSGGRCVSSRVSTSGFYTETGGCDCSLKVLLMMGKMLPETCSAAFTQLIKAFTTEGAYSWLFYLKGTIFVPYFPTAQCLPYGEDIYTFTRVKIKHTKMWPLLVHCGSQLVTYVLINTKDRARECTKHHK
jgi:hypothetical protein